MTSNLEAAEHLAASHGQLPERFGFGYQLIDFDCAVFACSRCHSVVKLIRLLHDLCQSVAFGPFLVLQLHQSMKAGT
jgi:hypothetical protein